MTGTDPGPLFAADGLDLRRMRAERQARLQAQMEAQGVDALLLLGGSALSYATGAHTLVCDEGRAGHERTAALLARGDAWPHLFTAYPEGAPPELPAERVHPPLYPFLEAGAEELCRRVLDLLGGPRSGRLALDERPAALHFRLARGLGGLEVADAGPVLGPAKLCKTPDELECIRRAQRINELAMYDVQAALRPGVRQTELSGIFLRRIFELGATGNCIDPIWHVAPPTRAQGPWTTHGGVAFPLVTRDRILAEGEVLWPDTGLTYHGYASDFGRTWIVGHRPRPNERQRRQFRIWRDVVDAVLERVRPGVNGAALTEAARKAAGEEKPWLEHFYLIHGVGTDSAEMPLIGTDLGPAFDEALVLAPGMVMVLEPAIWDEGHAGYRSEEIVAVTADGWRMLSDYPYDPYE